LAASHGGTQQRVDDRALSLRSELDCFIHCGVLRRFRDEELIETKAQKIAKIDIYVRTSKRSNPKVEERKIS
jgi:hypothetical protein